jgi:hypothetical protein
MPLFKKQPATPIDPDFEKVIMYDTPRLRDATRKFLAKSQIGVLAELEADEQPVSIVGHWGSYGNLLVVTSRRLLNFKGPQLKQELRHSDVSSAAVITTPAGHFMASINTETSQMYPPDDRRRYAKEIYMSVTFDDPKDARNLCLIINAAH